MWSTLLENMHEDAPFVSAAPSPEEHTRLNVAALPANRDALAGAFKQDDGVETDMGVLGLQFDTARRNRVNGRVTLLSNPPASSSSSSIHTTNKPTSAVLTMDVDLAFGNCPQYIKPRHNWRWEAPDGCKGGGSISNQRTDSLSKRQVLWIETAETLFTATGYRGEGLDNRFGNDASHRGGSPGFVTVQQEQQQNEVNEVEDSSQQQTIVWIEFPGNNHFNSLGNLIMDHRIGVCFPNFTNGGLLQATGTATVEMGDLQNGGRRVIMKVKAVNELPPGSLPIRWDNTDKNEDRRSVQVARIVEETSLVKSFYLEPAAVDDEDDVDDEKNKLPLPSFQSGQHLPIEIVQSDGTVLSRRYSLSTNPHENGYYRSGHYRISVKRESMGQASSFLHSNVKVGDRFHVGRPAGDFVLPHNSKGPTVLLSSGIGVTPILSMLHDLASPSSSKTDNNNTGSHHVFWIHGARNESLHAMRSEVNEIERRIKSTTTSGGTSAISLTQHIFYSRPAEIKQQDDSSTRQQQFTTGRITATKVQALIPPDLWGRKATFFMCGPTLFMADLQTGLESLGVPTSNIKSESF